MKKRWIAIVLTAAMLLSLLSGCGKRQQQQADAFYGLWDEVKAVQDGEIALTMPFHGAVLTVSGSVSRTERTAALEVYIDDTEGQRRQWTSLVVVDNDLWLNVDQIAAATLDFPLIESRQEEIEELRRNQKAPWLHYTWEGDFWESLPAWKTLLGQFWQDSRADLADSIQADGENAWVLSLKGKALEQSGGAVAQRLLEKRAEYLAGFTDVMDQQVGLTFALPMSMEQVFDSLWNKVLRQQTEAGSVSDELIDLDEQPTQTAEPDEPDEEEEEALEEEVFDGETVEDEGEPEPVTEAEELKSVDLRLSRNGEGYGVELRHNDRQVFALTIMPGQSAGVEAPEQVMDFEDYYNDVYLLCIQSRGYVADVLEDVQPEEEGEHRHEDVDDGEPETLIYPLSTRPAEGYEGVELMQYLTEAGGAMQVPILTGYLENTVTSVNGDGELVNQLTLDHAYWNMQVYSMEAAGSPAEDVASEIEEYYDILILMSGYQVLEEISPVVTSGDGTCAAQGFSYQEDPYSPALCKLMVLMRQSDGPACTVLDFKLDLDNMTDQQQHQVQELFRYLDMEVPVSLRIA